MMTFDAGSGRIFYARTFDWHSAYTYLLSHKPIWFAAADYYMYFSLILLRPLTK